MKCVCCDKEIEVQQIPVKNLDDSYFYKPYYECCGYLRSDEDSNIYFDGVFQQRECKFVTRNDNKCTNISWRIFFGINDYKTAYFSWNFPFNFKNKEKQIRQIEKLMVFI
jgi:hypothetical protein